MSAVLRHGSVTVPRPRGRIGCLEFSKQHRVPGTWRQLRVSGYCGLWPGTDSKGLIVQIWPQSHLGAQLSDQEAQTSWRSSWPLDFYQTPGDMH